MENANKSIFANALNPFQQAGIVLVAFIVILSIAYIVAAVGITTLDVTFPWTLAASFLLFYAVFNSVFSLTATNDNAYWRNSFIAFSLFVLISGAVAYFVAGLGIDEIGGYKWMYIVITFVYLVFISIIGFIKRIVEFAQNEEWTKPMRRSKKRK